MVLINGTVATTATRVSQVTTNRTFKEALTAFARELAVVLPGALVSTDDALDARLFPAITAAATRTPKT